MKLISTAALAAALLVAPQVQAAPAGTYEIDPSHTFVLFEIDRNPGATAYGMVANGATGSFVYDPSNPGKMKVNFEIETKNIFSGWEKRDQHLKSPDFFNSRQFPKITFTSSKVTRSGDTYKVTGTLKMHGKSKTETFELKKIDEGKNQKGQDLVAFKGDLKINRADYGITYLEGYLDNTVNIYISADGLK